MTESNDPEARACAVCARVLDRVVAPDRVTTTGYKHSDADLPEDHPAVPVPYAAVNLRGRCDFCFVEHPTWQIPARRFDYDSIPDAGSADNWAACDTCAGYIAADRWTALRRYVLARYVSGEAPSKNMTIAELDTALGRLWRQLRQNITGAPVRRSSN